MSFEGRGNWMKIFRRDEKTSIISGESDVLFFYHQEMLAQRGLYYNIYMLQIESVDVEERV